MSFAMPPGSCDAHAHVIAASGYDFIAARSYTPPPAPEDAYLAMLERSGMRYGVLVQVSVYGTDNRYLCEVLRRHPQRLRGVAVVDTDVSDAMLAQLHADGVRGIRINALYGGMERLQHLQRLAERIAPLGWHVQLYLDGALLAQVAPQLTRLPCPVVLDHMAHSPAADGVAGDDFRRLRDVARADNVWVKLSAANRLSERTDFADTTALAATLIDDGDERLLWGSDWPHVACDPTPRTADLLALLAKWMPDPVTRHNILARNPQRLYGFGTS